jgi:hypothetical protein
LPHIVDTDERVRLCDRIETQYLMMGGYTTSVSSVRLRIRVCRTKFLSCDDKIALELLELKYEIERLSDLGTRISCWAWFLEGLTKFENHDQLEAATGLIADVSRTLSDELDRLLGNVADQFVVAEDAICALAKSDYQWAKRVVLSLNTTSARNKAFRAIARMLVSQRLVPLEQVLDCVESLPPGDFRDHVAVESMILLRHRAVRDNWRSIAVLQKLPSLVSSGLYRCQTTTVLACFAEKNAESGSLLDMYEQIDSLWKDVVSEPTRIELGYWVASHLADVSAARGEEWLDKTSLLVTHASISDNALAATLANVVDLAIRACARAFNSQDTKANEYLRVRSLVQGIGCPQRRLLLWVAFGIRSYFASNEKLAKGILDEEVHPLVTNDYGDDLGLSDWQVATAYPLYLLLNQSRAAQILSKLHSKESVALALRRAALVVLHRLPYTEPFSSQATEFKLDVDSVALLLTIVSEMSVDSHLHMVVDAIARSVTSPSNRRALTRTARSDILSKLDALARKKLPDPSNIKHEGFLVACLSVLYKAQVVIAGENKATKRAAWNALYDRARAIPNASDRAVVTAMVVVDSRDALGAQGLDWREKIRADIASIPSPYDRAVRYTWIAEIIGGIDGVDRRFGRELVSLGADLTVQLEDSTDAHEVQRRVIDYACAVDPKLADALIEKLAGDAARRDIALDQKRQIEAARSMVSDRNLDTTYTDEQLRGAALKNLASLNADRVRPSKLDELLSVTRRAQNMSLSQSEYMWDWIVESAIRKKAQSSSKEGAYKFFSGVLLTAEITGGLIGLITRREPIAGREVILPGNRDIFESTLTSWAEEQPENSDVYITDPYFGIPDLELIAIMHRAAPSLRFNVAASFRLAGGDLNGLADRLNDGWTNWMDEAPPNIDVLLIGFGKDDQHPIHDRWIVSGSSGLRLGTSANSIGIERISEVTRLSKSEAEQRRAAIVELFEPQLRSWRGERVRKLLFSL